MTYNLGKYVARLNGIPIHTYVSKNIDIDYYGATQVKCWPLNYNDIFLNEFLTFSWK